MPKFFEIPKKAADLQLVERDIPVPGDDEVLIKVHACGLCHSDCFLQYGAMTPDELYPLVPGHEIAGEITKIGEGKIASSFKIGDRVAIGWFGGCCYACNACREGEQLFCDKSPKVTGIQRDGGYGEYVVARAEALARIPDGLEYTQAGPLVCAGVTVYNAIRQNMGRAPAGSVVAVLGVGGLGHLAIQFAAKMGFFTVAVSRGSSKKEHALSLGAHSFIDSSSQDVAAELLKLGGAKIIVVTTTGGHDTLPALIGGMAYDGVMVMCGVDDAMNAIPVNALQLIMGRKSIRGAASGHSRDSEETMNFAARFGVKVKTEVFPFIKAKQAYDHMKSGKGDLRVVITLDE